jgi:membrane protease YdiL (CAAX protease family)
MTSDASPTSQPVLAKPSAGGATPLWEDRLAVRLRGFGPLGILAILVILFAHLVWVPLAALMVLVWTRLSGTPWREIGYVRPKSWVGSVAIGVIFGVAFKLLMKSIVMPMLGADPINHAYHYLAGNRAEIPWFLLTVLGAGLGEETLFRGYAFERLGKLFGSGVGAKALIVLITSIWFGLAHYLNLGITGVEHAAIVGLVFGTIFAMTGRIFMLMSAHTAFDLTAYAIIFWNLESKVAHLFFK